MTSYFFYTNQTLTQLKRRIYMVLIPIFILSFGTLCILVLSSGNSDMSKHVSLLSQIGVLVLCMILLWVNKRTTNTIDILLILTTTIIYNLNLSLNILTELGHNGNVHLGPIAYWMATAYLLYFFILKRKVALIFSLLAFSFSVILGIIHTVTSPFSDSNTIDTLIQFNMATIGFIICLYFTQHIFEGFLEFEVNKRNAVTDYLTGLPNRRNLDNVLQDKILVAQNGNQPLSIILFDVDNFKRVNDIYGHEIGDEVLVELTSFLTKHLPNNALFGRWGGEEFLIIAENLSSVECIKLGETLREKLSKQSFQEVGTITCSFGIAELQATDQPKDLLKRADEALYLAKDYGKNQVQYIA
ncbi:GGDEF domain-containing protein [Cytobacillus suaedae]|nr:GGDEF domain-containing protein [Cytobacillus suaedae]